jgi:hypothetical protein
MPRVGFEPTIAVFKRARTVHALDRAATVIGDEEVLLTWAVDRENGEAQTSATRLGGPQSRSERCAPFCNSLSLQ